MANERAHLNTCSVRYPQPLSPVQRTRLRCDSGLYSLCRCSMRCLLRVSVARAADRTPLIEASLRPYSFRVLKLNKRVVERSVLKWIRTE